MSTPELTEDLRGGVLRLTICREERRNAMSAAVLAGLAAALERVNRTREAQAIVVTGAGTKAFCAGADLQTGTSFRFDYSQPTLQMADLLRLARSVQVPLIARVNGACVAGGMGLIGMCDLAVAARHAVFGLPEVKVGLFPAQVLSVLHGELPRRVLNEMCITGEPITADRAYEVGLVNAVADDVDTALDALLARIVDKSPAAMRRGLYTLKRSEEMAFEDSIAFTESQIGLLALTEDAAEGQAAFREKRQPAWKGR
ncbi:MAG TPA: enoyl-CoA hydratase-related protein [Ramlibacter sp.]|nr:enoyl-CoA hydratase-related protein [Ramlibacter sp.]